MDVLLNHLHNKVIHFPIVLAYVAAGLALWSLREPRARRELRGILLVGALLAVVAYFSGEQAEEAAEARGVAESLLELHERAGTLTTILFVLSALLAWAEPVWSSIRRLTLGAVLILSAVVTWSGYLGGQIAHPSARSQPSYVEVDGGEGGEGGGGLRLLPGGGEEEPEEDDD